MDTTGLSLPTATRVFTPPLSRGGVTIYRCLCGPGEWKSGQPIAWTAATFGAVLCLDPGGVVFDHHGHRCLFQPGETLLLFPGRHHAYGPEQRQPWAHAAILCDGPAIAALHDSGHLRSHQPLVQPAASPRLRHLWSRLLIAGDEHLAPLAYSLLYELGNAPAKFPQASHAPHPVDALITAIRQDPLRDWDCEREASALDIGTAQLRRLVRERTGDPPQRLIARERMRIAGRHLLAGASAAEAGASIGMPDPGHFSRRFSQLMGLPPGRWTRAINHPQAPT